MTARLRKHRVLSALLAVVLVLAAIWAVKLAQVARAEEFMRREGFRQVRVRHHGEIARLEVGPEELERAFAEREKITAELLDAGFLYVTLDLAGYKSGSLNAALKKGKKSLPVIS